MHKAIICTLPCCNNVLSISDMDSWQLTLSIYLSDLAPDWSVKPYFSHPESVSLTHKTFNQMWRNFVKILFMRCSLNIVWNIRSFEAFLLKVPGPMNPHDSLTDWKGLKNLQDWSHILQNWSKGSFMCPIRFRNGDAMCAHILCTLQCAMCTTHCTLQCAQRNDCVHLAS